jgi:hypothetical protein
MERRGLYNLTLQRRAGGYLSRPHETAIDMSPHVCTLLLAVRASMPDTLTVILTAQHPTAVNVTTWRRNLLDLPFAIADLETSRL